jgi:hypothetical protein
MRSLTDRRLYKIAHYRLSHCLLFGHLHCKAQPRFRSRIILHRRKSLCCAMLTVTPLLLSPPRGITRSPLCKIAGIALTDEIIINI